MSKINNIIKRTDLVLKWFCMDADDIENVMKKNNGSYNYQLRPRTNITKKDAIDSMCHMFKELNTHEFALEHWYIFEKLVSDGYISQNGELYSITFNGKFFNANGGYSRQLKMQKSRKKLNDLQSWVIAIGTIAAGGYALKEVLTSEFLQIILLVSFLSIFGTALCLILFQRYSRL